MSLAVLALALLAACGEEPSGTRVGTKPPQDVRPGHLGIREAAARAKEKDQLLLVLVRPQNIVCPPADALEQMLRKTPGLEEKVVLVNASGSARDEREIQLMRAARKRGAYPPMLAIATPQLEILHVQIAGLMPYYDMDGRPFELGPRPLLTGEEVLALVETARAQRHEVDTRLAALDGSPRAEDRLERAELLLGRGRWDEARATAAGVDRDQLSLKHARRLFDLLLTMGVADEARTLAISLVKAHGDERGAAWLELRLLWNFPESASLPPRLSTLIREAAEGPCRPLEFALRALRVRFLSQAPDGDLALLAEDLERLRELDRSVFAALPEEGPRVVAALLAAALMRRDFAEAERMLVALDRDYPNSPEAANTRHGTLDRIRKSYDGPPYINGPRREPSTPPSHPPPARR